MSFDDDYLEYESNRKAYRNIEARHCSEQWQVVMMRSKVRRYIGQYGTLQEAVAARNLANKQFKRLRRERKF